MFFRKHKPVGNDNQPLPAQPTYISTDSTVEGTLESEGEIHIDGTVRGQVKSRVCVVGTRGVVEGQITADDIVVMGRVIGPLRANHVHLQPGATVEGDITSASIAIDNGARLSGAVWQAEEAVDGAQTQNAQSAAFSDLLWSFSKNDSFRPIKSIRPRG